MKAARLQVIGTVAGLIGIWAITAGGCANEQQKKGQELYAHYCMHCHGENGRQNEGFNWSSMPDPKPKDLSNKSEMGTFKDEDIFNTISRDMKDTSPGGDKIGDDDFAVPTMPTFKYTLSEDEIWAIVGYVRTLHGMKLDFKVEERKRELTEAVKTAQEKFDQAKQTFEAAYVKEDIRGFLSCLGQREFGLAAVYPSAYLSLLAGLPRVLLERREILKRKAPGNGVEAALDKNPEFFSGLDESLSPRLDAAVVFEYYRWELARFSSP